MHSVTSLASPGHSVTLRPNLSSTFLETDKNWLCSFLADNLIVFRNRLTAVPPESETAVSTRNKASYVLPY